MQTWSVTARGLASVEVQGRNWIVALGRGLEELGRVSALQRLACEVLPNGTVIARDIATGTGYIVQHVGEAPDRGASESRPPESHPGAPDADDASGLLPLHGEDTSEVPTPMDDEEHPAEPVFDLPADAISELSVDESPLEAILASDTPKEACRIALEAALKKVPAEAGAVILEERGYLRFLAVEGPASRKLTGVRLPLGTGVAGYAMEKRKTVVLANAHDDPRHCGEVDALTGYVTREIAVVPLLRGDKVLGVLELMNLRGGGRFGDPDLDVLRRLADGLATRLAH
jgi:hypothetical protein